MKLNWAPLFFFAVCSALPMSLHAQAKPNAPGKMVDIGGYSLYINCTGQGSPTVILENGLGDVSSVWSLVNTLDLYVQSSAAQRGDADLIFVTCNGRQLRRSTLRYNFVRICARARIHQEHGHSPTPGMHDLRHTFAVHCLEAWLRDGKDLRQKLPVLSGYLGHAILISTEQYLRLVPGRFIKPLATLQATG